MALKTQFIHGAHFHCLPRRAAGSDARGRKWSCEKGGKRPQTHFRLYEVTVSGKETCGGATGTMSVCLFSLSVSQKRGKRRSEVGGGGGEGEILLKNWGQSILRKQKNLSKGSGGRDKRGGGRSEWGGGVREGGGRGGRGGGGGGL